MAAVDVKRGYVGMCNGRPAQQESRAALSKNSMFTAGAKNYIVIYSYYTRCALIRDRQPTAWDDFARPAEAEATCIRKVIEASRREARVPREGDPVSALPTTPCVPPHKRLQSLLSPRCPLDPLGLMGSHLCKQQSVECVCDE